MGSGKSGIHPRISLSRGAYRVGLAVIATSTRETIYLSQTMLRALVLALCACAATGACASLAPRPQGGLSSDNLPCRTSSTAPRHSQPSARTLPLLAPPVHPLCSWVGVRQLWSAGNSKPRATCSYARCPHLFARLGRLCSHCNALWRRLHVAAACPIQAGRIEGRDERCR
jgi:hypothetical protein